MLCNFDNRLDSSGGGVAAISKTTCDTREVYHKRKKKKKTGLDRTILSIKRTGPRTKSGASNLASR